MRSLTLLLALAFLRATPSPAQVFESIGTRATGVAGAFVAVADDATAAYWNPAGLTTGGFFSMLVDHVDSARWRIGPGQTVQRPIRLARSLRYLRTRLHFRIIAYESIR